jgi:hypothetical protein
MAGTRLHRASKFFGGNPVRWSNISCRPKCQHDGEHQFCLDGESNDDRLVNYLILKGEELHRRTRERLAARVTELELKLDPSRTSSLLTSKGLTRKGDE